MEDSERETWLGALAKHWSTAKLSAREAALCNYAEKLTQNPMNQSADDTLALRHVGLDDAAIHDAIQVVAYFNYINRVAEAVHVDLEPDMPPYE